MRCEHLWSPHRAIFDHITSVRSTNVYEEQSLGIYPEDEDDDMSSSGRTGIWGHYLKTHARRQLSFGKISTHPDIKISYLFSDMWWLGSALFLVCIIEVGSPLWIKARRFANVGLQL